MDRFYGESTEGHGEVSALPVLLRRISFWKNIHNAIIGPPLRVQKDRFLNRPEEFRRMVMLAAQKCGENGSLLILLDADDDCPLTKAPEILARAKTIAPHRPISVVLANREFEAWFIGAAQSLHGSRGLAITSQDLTVMAEEPRDAKGWLGRRMPGTYGETTDQPAFAAIMDLEQAHTRCRSFRKLCKEWTTNLTW
jgi:hypothetical protein